MRFTFPVFVLFLLSSAMDVHGGLVSKEVTYGGEDILLKGYLVYDDETDSKRPGVLVVHEWWGLNVHAKQKADALAREGYIALALDMTCLGIVDTPRGSIFCRYRRCVYERPRNFHIRESGMILSSRESRCVWLTPVERRTGR